jgi:hypothetical protein
LNRNRIAVSLVLVLLVGSTFLGCEVPDKGTAEWHANQGYKLINEGCWDEVIEGCNKAIELDPSLASLISFSHDTRIRYDICQRLSTQSSHF